MISILETNDSKLIARLAENVQQLHVEMYPDIFKPYDTDALELAVSKFLADPNCKSFVAMKDESAIGYTLCFVREIKENAFHFNIKTVYIDQICVLNGYEKSGAGTLLMNEVERFANEKMIRRIELDHWSENTIAASFFRRRGYEVCKERLFKLI